MQEVTSTDLYEVACYLANGCELVAVEGEAINNQFTCHFTVAGKHLFELQFAWFKGQAMVNVLHFRRAYLHAVNYVNEARKKYKRSLSGGATGGDA
jgi:hypothetical protein